MSSAAPSGAGRGRRPHAATSVPDGALTESVLRHDCGVGDSRRLASVTAVNASGRGLTSLDGAVLQQLSHLHSLNLSHNHLGSDSLATLAREPLLTCLRVLDLSHNRLVDHRPLAAFKALTTLRIDGNNLDKAAPLSLALFLPSLKRLDAAAVSPLRVRAEEIDLAVRRELAELFTAHQRQHRAFVKSAFVAAFEAHRAKVGRASADDALCRELLKYHGRRIINRERLPWREDGTAEDAEDDKAALQSSTLQSPTKAGKAPTKAGKAPTKAGKARSSREAPQEVPRASPVRATSRKAAAQARAAMVAEEEDEEDEEEGEEEEEEDNEAQLQQQSRHRPADGRKRGPPAASKSAAARAKRARAPTSTTAAAAAASPRRSLGPAAAPKPLATARFEISHLLALHGTQAAGLDDRQTEVWACAAPPPAAAGTALDDEGEGEADGNLVATAGGENVCVLDCTVGRVMFKYNHPGEEFFAVAWSRACPDGSRRAVNIIAAAGIQGDIKLIDLQLDVCYDQLPCHTPQITCLAFDAHNDGRTLYAGADDGTIFVWRIGVLQGSEDGAAPSTLLAKIDTPGAPQSLCVGQDAVVYAAMANGEVWRYQDSTGPVAGGTLLFAHNDVADLVFPTDADESVFLSKAASEGKVVMFQVPRDGKAKPKPKGRGRKSLSDLGAGQEIGGLKWPVCPQYHLKGSLVSEANGDKVLLLGGPQGQVFVYTLSKRACAGQAPGTLQAPTLVLPSPGGECRAPVRGVAVTRDRTHIVGAFNNNVVAIWARQ